MTLGKEVQLKHRAPVLAIQILDGSCIPVTSMSQSGMYKLVEIHFYMLTDYGHPMKSENSGRCGRQYML